LAVTVRRESMAGALAPRHRRRSKPSPGISQAPVPPHQATLKSSPATVARADTDGAGGYARLMVRAGEISQVDVQSGEELTGT